MVRKEHGSDGIRGVLPSRGGANSYAWIIRISFRRVKRSNIAKI